jgi:hypothetical protein
MSPVSSTRISAMTRCRPGHMWAPNPKGRLALRRGRGRPSFTKPGSEPSGPGRNRLYLGHRVTCHSGRGRLLA